MFRQPIGVIGGILPWNFPFFLIARKAGPALITGNTIVIEPSEETPHNAVKFCEILAEPPGIDQRGARARSYGGARAVVFAEDRNDQLHG
jgi:acyl-CoA reductase-like NAD-dependent aldehyde dehydrogenase